MGTRTAPSTPPGQALLPGEDPAQYVLEDRVHSLHPFTQRSGPSQPRLFSLDLRSCPASSRKSATGNSVESVTSGTSPLSLEGRDPTNVLLCTLHREPGSQTTNRNAACSSISICTSPWRFLLHGQQHTPRPPAGDRRHQRGLCMLWDITPLEAGSKF